MIVWLDAHLPPALVGWLRDGFALDAHAVRDLGLRDAPDEDIFAAARNANAVVLTKDSDFLRLLERHGPPPRVLWLTCGNTSNANLQRILTVGLPSAIELLNAGEPLVELGSPPATG